MKITDHWIEGVERVETNKITPGVTIKPRAIVMHYTAGWSTAGDINQLARAPAKVSAHLVLSREGEWTQLVPFNRRAWHAGPSQYPLNAAKPIYTDLNDVAIGIEISNAGWVKKLSNGNFIDQYNQQITPAGQFVGQKRKTATPPKNWPMIKHSRVGSGELYWEPYTPAQIEALLEFVAAAEVAYNIKHVVSHEEIDKRRWKTDPGPLLDLRPFRKLIEPRDTVGNLNDPPPSPTPTPRTDAVAVKELAEKSTPWWKRYNLIWR